MRAQMEQYYLDNRTYATVSASIVTPCVQFAVTASASNLFNVGCTGTPTNIGYVLTATGTGTVLGAAYTVDQTNAMQTTGYPNSWGTPPTNSCWLMRKGDSC